MSYNRIARIEGISHLPKLRSVGLEGNPIKKMENLKKVPLIPQPGPNVSISHENLATYYRLPFTDKFRSLGKHYSTNILLARWIKRDLPYLIRLYGKIDHGESLCPIGSADTLPSAEV